MNTVRTLLILAAAIGCCACATTAPAPDTGYADAQKQAAVAIRDGALVIDVRTPAEFEEGHIEGALHIPHDQLAGRLDELAGHRNEVIILYCRSGRRSGIADEILRENGFT